MNRMSQTLFAVALGIFVGGCEYPRQTRMEPVYPTTAPATSSPTNSSAKPDTVKKAGPVSG